ncbi:MAG: DUF2141 domain-containing protein [Hyphomicrobiales bacterium]|nr:DUF2141 domain-containing protein [Hyphomicrobiales bacterium]
MRPIYAFAACFALMAPTLADAATLTLKISGLRSDNGVVRLCVFSEKTSAPAAYPDCAMGSPFKKANAPIKGGEASVIFKDIPDGAYAISLFHDADGDGKISMKSLLGVSTAIPREGIGISNNPQLYGKPSFRQARFAVAGPTAIIISMKYF